MTLTLVLECAGSVSPYAGKIGTGDRLEAKLLFFCYGHIHAHPLLYSE